jgi:hypothetical protein
MWILGIATINAEHKRDKAFNVSLVSHAYSFICFVASSKKAVIYKLSKGDAFREDVPK